MATREEVFNGVGPFEDDDGVWVGEGFGEVLAHEAGVFKAVEVVVNKLKIGYRGGASVACAFLLRAPFVAIGDGERGGGDGLGDAEAAGEGTGEGGLAGADVADEFKNKRGL